MSQVYLLPSGIDNKSFAASSAILEYINCLPGFRLTRENGMVLVTKDKRCGRDCKAAGIECILLDDEELLKILPKKIVEYGDSPGD